MRIRSMRSDEISIAVDWAAAEGWNPGLADATCFSSVDPDGFLIGELDGDPVATISCVNYGASFAFLGFYIVRKDVRGCGHGLRIWNAALAHAGARVIGLDGVPAQQQNYKRAGFKLAYANIRYGGVVVVPNAPRGRVVALAEVPLSLVLVDDATVFPGPRAAFLRAWIGSPGHVGRAIVSDGRLVAWGRNASVPQGQQDRPACCRRSQSRRSIAGGLLAAADVSEIFLDIPSLNRDAIALAQDLRLAPVFETARMYTGEIPPLRLERLFGVTTLELG